MNSPSSKAHACDEKKSTNDGKTFQFSVWKQGRPISSDVKTVVLNVFCKVHHENPNLKMDDLLHACSHLTGISEGSIKKMRSDYHKYGKFKTAGKERLFRVSRSTKLGQRYEGTTFCTIRGIIYDFFRRNEIPTLHKIVAAMKEFPELPKISTTSVHRLLQDMGFTYLKRKRVSILVEKEDVIIYRRKYLRKMRELRQQNRKIYYLDETWIDAYTMKSVKTLKSANGPPDCDDSNGKSIPCKLIIVHAGSSDGFVVEAADVFQAQLQVGGELLSVANFESWFRDKLLPNIPCNSVIVMDNAPYHFVKQTPSPTLTWQKGEIRRWLTEKDVSWQPDQLKPELLKLVISVDTERNVTKVETLGEKYNHEILCLPPYHSDLNPITEVWTLVKKFVGRDDRNLDVAKVKQLTEEILEGITPEQWTTFEKRVIAKEMEMWELGKLIEDNVENALSDAYRYQNYESNSEIHDFGQKESIIVSGKDLSYLDAF